MSGWTFSSQGMYVVSPSMRGWSASFHARPLRVWWRAYWRMPSQTLAGLRVGTVYRLGPIGVHKALRSDAVQQVRGKVDRYLGPGTSARIWP